MYIADQDSLEAFAERARQASVLAIDTEFLREKTYYPKLCLLQVSADDEVAVIDPFSIASFDPLLPLFEDESIMKVFHAGSQDLEILLRETGVLPKPIFDTQIAAALLGHTQQIGLSSLVHAELGVQLRKIDSFTDWSQRPLSDSQLQYAAEDVIYLPRLYERMRVKLKKLGRLDWLTHDFQEMSDPAHYEVDVWQRYKRLKRMTSLSRKQLAAARVVAAWRETTAQQRNLPRKWVLTDEQIVESCKREPRSLSELYMVRGMREKLPVRDARKVLALMVDALSAPEDSWPETERPGKSERNVDFQLDLMMAIVRLRSKESGIAIPTLASHDDMVKVARGYRDNIELLRGWRKAIVGGELLELLEGKLALSLDGSTLRIEQVENDERKTRRASRKINAGSAD